MLLEIILLTVALGNLLLGIHLWFQVKDLYDEPGLLGFPVLGNLYYFYSTLIFLNMNSVEKYFSNLSNKYGRVWWHWFASSKILIVSCPHLIEKLAFHPNISGKPPLIYGAVNAFVNGPFGRIDNDGEWKQKRKEYNLSMNKTLIDGSYHQVFIKISKEIIEKILENSKDVDSNYLAEYFTTRTILETHMDVKNRSIIDRDILHDLRFIMQVATFSLACPIISRIFLKLSDYLEPFTLGKLIDIRNLAFCNAEETLKKQEEQSFHFKEQTKFPFIATIKLRNKINKSLWNDYKKEFHELLGAGSHTVSINLNGAIVFMAQFPEIQEKAWKEQFEIFGTDTRDPTIDDLKEMEYLDRFIKESIRFCGPPYIAKYSTGEIIADGVKIPKGTNVVFFLRKLRMDPTYWKDPDLFDPDHFLTEDVPKYSYSPFGIGWRSCPGMNYASNEMKVLLSFILRRFKLSSSVKFEDLEFNSCLMIDIKNSPLLQFEERRS